MLILFLLRKKKKKKKKKKLATLVEGDPKAPFSIATTPRFTGGRYSIPKIAPLYSWSLPYKCKDASSNIFWIFSMTRPGIEPRSREFILAISLLHFCVNKSICSKYSKFYFKMRITDSDVLFWFQIYK